MGIEENIAVKNYSETFFKAFKIHTFVLDNISKYSINNGFFTTKNTNARQLHEDNTDYLFIALLFFSIVTLTAYLYTEFQHNGLATLLAAFVAGLYARMTLNQQKENHENSLSLPAVTNFFSEDNLHLKSKSSTLNGQKRLIKPAYSSEAVSSYIYDSKAIQTLQKVIIKTNSIPCPFDKSLFLTTLAMKSNNKIFERVTSEYEHYQFIDNIDVSRITRLLNKAENLCQGINGGVYNEALIQNYLGSDLSTLTSVLLPYIYTRREIHAKRLSSQKKGLIEYTDDTIEMYKQHSETHDLLYEHLEYYSYKWYWSDSPVRFNVFHNQLASVYKALETYYTLEEDNRTPYIKYALEAYAAIEK